MKHTILSRILVSAVAGSCLVAAFTIPSSALPQPLGQARSSFAFATNAHPHGQTYSGWSAAWWQWCMELPLAGHPGTESGSFDVTSGQTGDTWFLAAPIVDLGATTTRACTIPADTSLFVMLAGAEWSSLEGGVTETEQRDLAVWQADHFVPSTLFCTLDGVALANPTSYRFQSPQLAFDAPSPWLFGPTGGAGTAVGDGYYAFLKQLPQGQHTLHYGGLLRFTLAEDGFDYEAHIDMTYDITQLGG